MINHTRTLLLNSVSTREDPLPDGEEFIPLNFTPLTKAGKIRDLHDIIIPPGVSRLEKNFLAFNFMRLLHSPDFVEITLTFDSRFTYDLSSKFFLNLSADQGAPTLINLTSIHEQFALRAVATPELFAPFPGKEDEQDALRKIFRSSDSTVDRLTAGILSLSYQLEAERRAR
jgi:hypothetical protein